MELGAPDTLYGLAAVVLIQVILEVGKFAHSRGANRRQKSSAVAVKSIERSINGRPTSVRDDMDAMRVDQKTILALVYKIDGRLDAVEHRVDQMTTVTESSPRIVRPTPRTGW